MGTLTAQIDETKAVGGGMTATGAVAGVGGEGEVQMRVMILRVASHDASTAIVAGGETEIKLLAPTITQEESQEVLEDLLGTVGRTTPGTGVVERSLTRNKSGNETGAQTKFLAHTFVVGHDAPFPPSPLKAFQLSKRFSLPFPICAGRAQPSRPTARHLRTSNYAPSGSGCFSRGAWTAQKWW